MSLDYCKQADTTLLYLTLPGLLVYRIRVRAHFCVLGMCTSKMILLLSLMLNGASSVFGQQPANILNPHWVLNIPNPAWGDGTLVQDPTIRMPKKVKGSTSDGEAIVAAERYFYGMTGGVSLEMGAINGNWSSESYELQMMMGWKRVLIEGSPAWRKQLKRWTSAYVYNCAVCEKEQKVHYIVNKNFFVSGILEFMTPEYVKKWYKGIYKLGLGEDGIYDMVNLNQTQLDKLPKWAKPIAISCLPMSTLLKHSGLHHINFMILDVEGAELVALKSIDFTQVKFDVMVIEKNRGLDLIEFFKDSDYLLDLDVGRNLWFVHKSFVPSRSPDLQL